MSFIVIIALSLCLYSSTIESTGRSWDFSLFLWQLWVQGIVQVQCQVPSFLPIDWFIDHGSSFDGFRCFELGSFFSSNEFVSWRIALYYSHTDRRNRWDLISRSTLSDISIRESVTLSKVVWKTYGLLLGLFAFSSSPKILMCVGSRLPIRALCLLYLSHSASSRHPSCRALFSAKPILELLFLFATLLLFSSEIFLSNAAHRIASSHFGLSSSRRTLSRGASLLRSSRFSSIL